MQLHPKWKFQLLVIYRQVQAPAIRHRPVRAIAVPAIQATAKQVRNLEQFTHTQIHPHSQKARSICHVHILFVRLVGNV